MRCSTDGSAGVVLSDLRKDDSPGASGAAPCAIFRTICHERSCTRCFGSGGDVVAVSSGVCLSSCRKVVRRSCSPEINCVGTVRIRDVEAVRASSVRRQSSSGKMLKVCEV